MKRPNIAKIGCEIEVAVSHSAISFDGNTLADKGNGLFVFQSGGVFVQAICFPFFEPCLFFQLCFALYGLFVFFDIFLHSADSRVVAIQLE